MRKCIVISYVCIFAITLGYAAIHKGYIDIGSTLANTVVSGYFGYSKQNNNDFIPEMIFLLSVLLGAYIIFFYSYPISFVASLGVVTPAIGGYLGYLQQEK